MVEVTWANSVVDQNVILTSNDINRIDRTGQLFNGKTYSGNKWAYIHSGLKADGSFKAMPELDTERQAGWYGAAQVGDGSGVFSTPPWLQVAHDPRAYSAILIAGDSVYDEYPVDFTVTFTHPGGPTVITVTGNTSRIYFQALSYINNVSAVRLTITKWSAPNTIVKVIQMAGALIELYKAGDITSLDILEETNSDTGAVPIGNVSANELDLALLNTARRFSYGNTDSPYLTSLRSGRKIRVWLGFVLPPGSTDMTGDVDGYIVITESGLKVGYMPYGIYWSKDWISSFESQETTTTAYDITYRLGQKDFLKSLNYTGPVEDIVNAILTEAKNDIPDLAWRVSPDTAGIVLTNVAFQPKGYLEILKDLAEVTLSYTYVDRDGILVVGEYLEAVTPLKNWQKFDMSDYYNFQSDPKLDELINRVRVGYTQYIEGGVPPEDIYSNDDTFEIPGSGVLDFYIAWSKAPIKVWTASIVLTTVSGVPLLTRADAYAFGAFLQVTGAPGDTFKISATGNPYTLEENTETTAEYLDSITLYGVREFSLTGNILITTPEEAQALVAELITRYGQVRQDAAVDWPMTTLVSIGSTIEVVEFKSATVETKGNFIIKRQSIKYDGALQGNAELRRA
jgi:hypothetical protein